MQDDLRTLDTQLRRYAGLGLVAVTAICICLAAAGAIIGLLFPKFQATALLQFPEVQHKPEKKFPLEQRSFDSKANVIELAAYKRVAASYDSVSQFALYFEALGQASRPAAVRLLRQAEDPGFWLGAATPILPFSRRDQKEFGDIKDASATTMLGLELMVNARTESLAEEMVNLLSGYYINAIVRERIRAWTLTGKVESQSLEKSVRADILKAELDIEIYGQRVSDMKAVLARYPDAARMDSRQVVSVNPSEGGERYLSPLAQLVGAESAISERHEMIRRWKRDLKQKDQLSIFYAAAEGLVERQIDVVRLIAELRQLSGKTFAIADATQEWNQEAALRVNGALDNFEVMRSQFGVRNGVRVDRLASRSPWRLAAFGLAAALGLLVASAFARATFQSIRRDPDSAERLESRPGA